MPRPRQRQSANARKEEKRLKREQQEKDEQARLDYERRQRERRTRMDWDKLPTQQRAAAAENDAGPAAPPPDPDALPEADPDTKAYFKRVSEQIDEMTAQGHGKNATQVVLDDNGEEVEEEIEDERPLLLRSALESLSGHEIELAGDGETSVVLEQLLYAMDDFARRVLLDRFAGQFERLVRHRSASHVLQTLFELAGETVDRETRGNVASGPITTGDAQTLPTMTDLLLSVVSELVPTLPSLIYDPFASHCIRILLLVLAGVPAATADPKARGERSKKSTQFRKGQGKTFGRNWLADDAAPAKADSNAKGKGRAQEDRFAVPSQFRRSLGEVAASLNTLDTAAIDFATGRALPSAGAVPGEGVRRAAMHEVAGPVMRILVELESLEGWLSGGWADRVLCGLVTQVEAGESSPGGSDLREEYLAGLLRHPASSPTFEMLLRLSPKPVFDALWSDFFVGKLHRLAANAVANFVVAVGISRVDESQLRRLVHELKAIPTERRGEWIDNFRTGVLRALLESATRLAACEGEVSEILLDTFGLHTQEERKLAVPCVLTLNRLQYWKKLATGATPEPSIQGSVLVQTWLRLHAPHNQVILDSIDALPFDSLLALSRSATASRILDVLLTAPTVPSRGLRTFIVSLLGHYAELADDRIGSRVAERCFASADVYLKDKIAQSLFDQQNDLQRSAYAHFFARKLELPLWGRRRGDWKAKMAIVTNEEKARLRAENGAVHLDPGATSAAELVADDVAASEGASTKPSKKKRERKADEVDQIFALGAGQPSSSSGADRPAKKKSKRSGEDPVPRAALVG